MQKKRGLILFLYLAVAAFGLLGAVLAVTIPQCVILIMVSLFACWCGFIIVKEGTVDSINKNKL